MERNWGEGGGRKERDIFKKINYKGKRKYDRKSRRQLVMSIRFQVERVEYAHPGREKTPGQHAHGVQDNEWIWRPLPKTWFERATNNPLHATQPQPK